MPPKKNEPSKKTIEKGKQKIIEDKTFGLKNKKGAKTQKYIEQVAKQVTMGNKSAREIELAKSQKINKKELERKEREELNALFKPVAEMQKVAKGVDPKSVLCVFFKQGTCKKGDRCKFSHDLNVERKTVKRNVYESTEKEEEGMDSWDQEKLEEVVSKKHGEKNRSLPATSIVCKFFLDALENSKYGWFWTCPNDPTCHYRHALPPGFVLKKDRKRMEEQQEKISLEDLIERERQALTASQLTQVTLASFLRWKKRKKMEKLAAEEEDKAKRRKDFCSGRSGGVSGREMFEFNPELVQETMEEGEEEGDVLDSRGLRCADDDEFGGTVREITLAEYDVDVLEAEGAAAGYSDSVSPRGAERLDAANGDTPSSALEVDENLFNTDDLEELEEELYDLDLEQS